MIDVSGKNLFDSTQPLVVFSVEENQQTSRKMNG